VSIINPGFCEKNSAAAAALLVVVVEVAICVQNLVQQKQKIDVETQDTQRLETMAFPDVSTFCLAKERWSETV
jgi:hypothetical protein